VISIATETHIWTKENLMGTVRHLGFDRESGSCSKPYSWYSNLHVLYPGTCCCLCILNRAYVRIS